MDHSAARGLDPTIAATGVAVRILALADHAGERDLGRGFGEGEVVRPEADVALAPKDLPRERIQGALEVGHRELLVDGEPLVLMEDALVDRVGRLVAVAATGDDDADRRLALLHDAHLHR